MITETYKGCHIKVTNGTLRGRVRILLNGTPQGEFDESQENALRITKANIDDAQQYDVFSGIYPPAYYPPNTYELCDDGHAKPIGGQCGRCAPQRTAAAA